MLRDIGQHFWVGRGKGGAFTQMFCFLGGTKCCCFAPYIRWLLGGWRLAESSDEVKVLCPGKNPDWPLSEIESTAFLLPSINFTFPPKIKECTNLEFSDSVLVFVLSPNFGTQMKPLAKISSHGGAHGGRHGGPPLEVDKVVDSVADMAAYQKKWF